VVRGTIQAIARVDPDVSREFETRDTIALGGWPGATSGRAWGSSARFAADVASGAIPEDVRVVMYDPEAWDRTPLDERLDPVAAIDAFGVLARTRGYSVIVTPHANLVEVPGSPHAPRDDESREDAYLRSGIIEAAAANADAVETQAQRMQRDPRAYRAFVGHGSRGAQREPEGRGAVGALDASGLPGDGRDADGRVAIRPRRRGRALPLAREAPPGRGRGRVPREVHQSVGPLPLGCGIERPV
jgi:hypothetical protein